MNDFRAEPEELIQAEIGAVERVLRSGWFVLGEEVREFERRWAAQCGVRAAVGVGNGMDAIEIGLRAGGIGAGDEVITTPLTAFATVLGIIRSGATPVLADVDMTTGLLEPSSVERCFSSRTKAVLLVHLYGHVREVAQWRALCDDAEIVFTEDCAQAHFAKWDGKPAGSHGLWGAYSFYPTKNLGTAGDGGALVTSEAELAERAKILRNYGQRERYYHTELGLNSRLDEVHAAILTERLQWLERFIIRRRQVATMYYRHIQNRHVQLLAQPFQEENHVYHLFVVLCEQRNRLKNYLNSLGIESLIHYPVPVHRQEPCKDIARDPKGLAICEAFAEKCLSIPCHPHMTDAEIDRVITAINDFS